jgi:hypothetical protein
MAQDAYEPNEGIHEAAGGLVEGTNYNAAIGSTSDRDWYIVHVSGQGALDITLNNLTDPPANQCSVTMTLRNSDGISLNQISASNAAIQHIVYTTPGPGHYFIDMSGSCPVNSYRLSLTGPDTPGPPPPAAEPTTNANRDAATAFGPLQVKVYGGSIDAFNEQDWFFFYTARAGTFDVALTNVPDAGNCSVSMLLREPDGTRLNSTSAGANTIAHIEYAGPRAAKYELQVTGSCPTNTYQLQITPANLTTSTPPPPPPDRDGDGVADENDTCPDAAGPGRPNGCPLAVTTPPAPTTPAVSARCTKARTAVTNWTKRLTRANKNLKSARKALKRRGLSSRKRASLKSKAKAERGKAIKAKRSLKSAQAQVTRYCT